MPKRPNTPYKTKTQRVGWTRVLSPSSGGHSKMSPTSTLRGLGLGETPLRRWEAVTEMGRSQALIRTIVTPSQRQTIDRGTTPRLTSVGYTDRCREVSVTTGKVRSHVGGRARRRHSSQGRFPSRCCLVATPLAPIGAVAQPDAPALHRQPDAPASQRLGHPS